MTIGALAEEAANTMLELTVEIVIEARKLVALIDGAGAQPVVNCFVNHAPAVPALHRPSYWRVSICCIDPTGFQGFDGDEAADLAAAIASALQCLRRDYLAAVPAKGRA